VNVRRIASEAGRLLSSQAKYFELCGKTYQENFFDVMIINIMEARNIQQVTALSFQDYGKANLINSAPMLGKGILFQGSAAWKHSRGIVKPTFSRVELSDVNFFGYHVDRFPVGAFSLPTFINNYQHIGLSLFELSHPRFERYLISVVGDSSWVLA
jgi:hypothetical protein